MYACENGGIFGGRGIVFHKRLNQWMYNRFGKDAKGETLSCHSIRHTFASRAAMNNVPLEVIAKLLDHQSMSTTMKYYARFSPKQIENAIEVTVNSLGNP